MIFFPFGPPNYWDPTPYLKGLHTRQLMNLREDCYRFGNEGTYIGNTSSNKWVTVEQVNAELSTREHIPNKKEAKEIRQQKALAKRNR